MPLRTAMAWRRKLSTLTPEIASGCWKPRNMPRAARLVGPEGGDVLAPEPDAAAGDLVARVGEERLGQGRLAGAVGSHQGVELALADGQRHAAQDLGVLRPGRGGPAKLEEGSGGRSHAPSVIPTIQVVEIPGRISRARTWSGADGSGRGRNRRRDRSTRRRGRGRPRRARPRPAARRELGADLGAHAPPRPRTPR